MTRATVAGALAVVAVAALCGCATPEPDAISAHITQYRSDVAIREAKLVVTNDTAEAITVGDVTVDDPRFAEPLGRVIDRESIIPAGASVGIRIALPAVACDVPSTATPRATLDYVIDGEARTLTTGLPDPIDFLRPLHERECLAQSLSAAASLGIEGFIPSDPGEPAELLLIVTPTGHADARVSAIRATNLLQFADSQQRLELDVVVGVGSTETTVLHLPVLPQRCDPHAVQEDKRGTIFTLEVDASGDVGTIELASPGDIRAQVLNWVIAWCEPVR